MRPIAVPVLLSLVVVVSCKEGGGGSTATETGAGTTDSPTTGASMSTGGGTGGGTTGGSGGESSGGGSSGVVTSVGSSGVETGGSGGVETGGSSGPDTTTGGGGSALMFSLIEPVIFSDCMPIVPPDPVHAAWTVIADNAAGMAPANVTITGASIVFDPDGAMDTHMITVTPTKFGPIPAGEVQMFMLSKQDTPGGLPGCSHCGEKVRFVFEWTIDGEPLGGQSEEVMQCAF